MTFFLIDDYLIDGLPIKVVRDDLFPFIGGGSKARKAVEYEKYLKESGCNAVVTCGGIQSNHNRAIALMAARNGWPCHLVIQGTEDRFQNEKGNALLCRLAGAECEFIDPSETAEAMDRAMQVYEAQGLRPFYVHGGGHDLPGGICFVDAVLEMKRQGAEKPDCIFLTSGTGSTQAGIVVGLELAGWGDVEVIGISVARQFERGRQVIIDYANMLANHYGIKKDFTEKIDFVTDYLFGGYEQFSPEMEAYLNGVMRSSGLVFDTTYSGKGFYGMMQEIEKRNLRGKKVVFWHTGGLMNTMK